MPGRTENAIVINAPMALVWDLTNDVTRWPELFTEYASATVLERRGETVRFRLTMHPDENGTAWSWVSERTPDASTRTVRSERIETGIFEYMKLFWRYTELAEGGVELRWVQEFSMKPSAPVDDRGAEQHLNRQTALEMANIKKVVEATAAEAAEAAAAEATAAEATAAAAAEAPETAAPESAPAATLAAG